MILVRKICLVIIFLLVLSMLLPLSSLGISAFSSVPHMVGLASSSVATPTSINIAKDLASSAPQPQHRVSQAVAVQSSSATSSARRLGFWIDERVLVTEGVPMSPQLFFQNYFLTPPFPSAMELVIGFDQAIGPANWISGWVNQVASMADKYPNIQIDFVVFVNMNVASQVQSMNQFFSAIGHGQHSSLGYAEYEREYYGNTQAELQSFKSILDQNQMRIMLDVTQRSYFPGQALPVINYAEFPYFQSSDSKVASVYSSVLSNEIGRAFGEYAMTSFPATCTLPSDPTVAPNPPCNGWNEQVVQTIVDDSLKVPAQNRQFTFFDAGYSTDYVPLWMNSIFRSWIWSDPNYVANYALSTTNALTSPPSVPPSSSPPPTSGSGTVSAKISTTNPTVGSGPKVTLSGLPKNSSLKVVIYNTGTHKIVATIFRGPASSTGSLSFVFKILPSMAGSDSMSIYSSSSSSPLLTVLNFTVP